MTGKRRIVLAALITLFLGLAVLTLLLWMGRQYTKRSPDLMVADSPQPRKVELMGPITDSLAQRVIAELLFHNMQDSSTPVELVINSQGGSVSATFAILDTMKFVKTPIWTICSEQASGCALVVLANGAAGHRTAHGGALFGMTRTLLKEGDPKTQETISHLERMNRRIVFILANASGRSEQEIAEGMEKEKQFTAEELRAYGLIDAVE